MPKALKLLTANFKEKTAHRNFERDSKYITDDFSMIASILDHCGIFGSSTYLADQQDTEDDASSVSSFSTTATTDCNRGAGYAVDKYFYQPVGRRIEKIAFRIAMPLLSPFRIFQYIDAHNFKGQLYYYSFSSQRTSSDLKTVYLAGLDSLVHQTRSNSLMRSSAALSALIRLCPTNASIARFFYLVHKQIGHPSLALSTMDTDTQEKKCYLFLMSLIWAHPGLSEDGLRYGYNINYSEISHSYLKESLLKLVNSWHYSKKDAFAIMSQVSLHFAQALYNRERLLHLGHTEYIELVYFFTIFIVHFIPFINNNFNWHTFGQQTQQLCHMLLLTFLRSLDSALSFVARQIYGVMRWCCTPHMLQTKLAIQSLLLHDPVFAALLPVSTGLLRSVNGLSEESLPRNRRHGGEHLSIADTFIRASIARTQRLLTSLDELEREIRDSMSRLIPKGNYITLNYIDTSEHAQRHAQRVHVIESELSKEFLEARRDWCYWSKYEERRRMRHEWGICLCSNLDWDWDVAGCLERLFELPEEVTQTTARIATVSPEAGKANTWNIFTDASLPTEMNIVYKSTTGETKYKTIMICPSTDDVASAGESSNVVAGHHEPGHAGDEESENVAGVITDEYGDSASEPEAELGLGVKQVVVSLIPEEPSCAGRAEDREGSEVIEHEGYDAPLIQDIALGPMNNRCGHGTAYKDDLKKLMKIREAKPE